MTLSEHERASIEFEDRGEYLYAYVTGPKDNEEISIDYWQRVIAECKKRGVDRLLIEKSAEGLEVPPRIGARECSFWLLVPL